MSMERKQVPIWSKGLCFAKMVQYLTVRELANLLPINVWTRSILKQTRLDSVCIVNVTEMKFVRDYLDSPILIKLKLEDFFQKPDKDILVQWSTSVKLAIQLSESIVHIDRAWILPDTCLLQTSGNLMFDDDLKSAISTSACRQRLIFTNFAVHPFLAEDLIALLKARCHPNTMFHFKQQVNGPRCVFMHEANNPFPIHRVESDYTKCTLLPSGQAKCAFAQTPFAQTPFVLQPKPVIDSLFRNYAMVCNHAEIQLEEDWDGDETNIYNPQSSCERCELQNYIDNR